MLFLKIGKKKKDCLLHALSPWSSTGRFQKRAKHAVTQALDQTQQRGLMPMSWVLQLQMSMRLSIGWDPPRAISAPQAVLDEHDKHRAGYNHVSPPNTSALFNVQTSVLHMLLVTSFPRNSWIAHKTQSIPPASLSTGHWAIRSASH